MDSESPVRRLDRPDNREDRVRTGSPKRIGIIGKADLTEEERTALFRLGTQIAQLDCTVVLIPTKGTANTVREGVEAADGETEIVDRGVITRADHTLVYPDSVLLTRLLEAYPDLEDNDKVTIIDEGCVPRWNVAMEQLINR